MILSTNQPYFAPYPGFFYKAQLSDCLVILDGVQFPRKTTWITRNRFKNDQGTLWMTIPVRKKGLGFQKISEVRICYAGNWQQKYLRSFHHAYANAPFLLEYVGLMERALSLQFDYLLDLNMEIISAIMGFLEIDTRVVRMSELGVGGKGTGLVIDICKSMGASQFLVQSSARAYYDPAQFESEGLELISFNKPRHLHYRQPGETHRFFPPVF